MFVGRRTSPALDPGAPTEIIPLLGEQWHLAVTPRHAVIIRGTPGSSEKVKSARGGRSIATGSIEVTAEGFQGNGYAAHRQTASDRVQPEGERSPFDRGESADAAVAWSHATAGNEGARAGGHGLPDEEHHTGALPAGAPGGWRDGLRLRVRRDGPVPGRHLQAARQCRAGVAADTQRVLDLRTARLAPGHRGVDHAAERD